MSGAGGRRDLVRTGWAQLWDFRRTQAGRATFQQNRLQFLSWALREKRCSEQLTREAESEHWKNLRQQWLEEAEITIYEELLSY